MNDNRIPRENLILLTQSIFTNGWTMPVVCTQDNIIIDGFHRWTISGPEWTYKPKGYDRTLNEILNGKIPRVIVEHKEQSENIYGTVTHNRARGTHLLEPMKAIIKQLLNEGRSIDEISVQLGMRKEEVFRLTDFSKQDFLKLMVTEQSYSKAKLIKKI